MSIGERMAKLGDRARPGDSVFLDKKLLELKSVTNGPRVIAYHKPVGEIVTRNDPEGRPTVFERLPKLRAGRWIAIGRLDLNSSGLLLFTDSGALANRLMHPSQEIEREYAVRVQGGLSEEACRRLLAGVELDDGLARFRGIDTSQERKGEGTNRWYRVILAEGRNREVRRLVEAVGSRVSRLVRVRFGPVALPRELPPGRALELSPETVAKIARTGKSC